jgi:hypothetical protein
VSDLSLHNAYVKVMPGISLLSSSVIQNYTKCFTSSWPFNNGQYQVFLPA